MSAASSTLLLDKPYPFRAVLFGGLTAGVLDISSAFINSGLRGRSPIWVLQSIAGGFLGSDSFKQGLPSAALGLAVHFLIAFVACTVFVTASLKFKVLTRRVVVSGLFYGIAVYLFMYLIVLPLTFHRSFVTPISAVVIAVLIHMSCVGLPISLITGWYFRRNGYVEAG